MPWTRRSSPLAVAVAMAACTFTPPPAGAFYSPGSDAIPAKPGSVIRHEAVSGAPAGAQAYRVLYSSTGLDGKPIAVSGLVIIPYGAPPRDGWDVVAWAHPTTGVDPRCAPSHRDKPLAGIQGLAPLVTRGYVVTATDYPGLGTSEPHPYLVGVSEGRAVLDLVRAARALPGERIGPRFAVWGHSQGGQAALFTGQLAASYAPELALVGVGAVAPATDLGLLLDDDFNNSVAGRVLLSYAVWSWSRVYDAPTDSLVKPSALPVVDRVAAGCIETLGELAQTSIDASPLKKGFLYHHPDSVEPWSDLLERNHPGTERTGAPFFLVQGTSDNIVRPLVTLEFVHSLCARGETVRYLELRGVGHMGAAEDAAPLLVGWMIDRFAGNPAPNDCDGTLKRGVNGP